MRRFPALALVATLAHGLTSPLLAEQQTACTILGCERVEIEVSPFSNADNFSVQQVWGVVNDILGVSGLAPNFQVVETTEVGNAAAVIIKGERYLAFNPVWMDRYRTDPNAKWQLYAVMAHEVGHHLQGHTLGQGGSKPPTELEADEYAGFTLAALGATLPQAQALWQTLSEQGSATHPARRDRLAAVQRGWERRNGPATSAPAPAPTVSKKLPPAPAARRLARPNRGPETCSRTSVAGTGAAFCVTSVLASQGSNSYGPANALDNNAATAWVEGAAQQGIGVTLSYDFAAPTQLKMLELLNGYGKSDRTFSRNSRIKAVRMTTSDGVDERVTLIDQPGWQALDLSDLPALDWIAFEVLEVYPGSHYTDTALSEFILR